MVVTLLIDVVDFVEVFWSSPRDPSWEARWRALDPAESAWLAVMAASRAWLASLTDPEELELAKGFRRQERRHRFYLDLASSPLLIAAALLALIGVLPAAALGILLGSFAVLRGLLVWCRERRVQKAYREAKANYGAATAAEPAHAA